jgi:hypothetical protein
MIGQSEGRQPYQSAMSRDSRTIAASIAERGIRIGSIAVRARIPFPESTHVSRCWPQVLVGRNRIKLGFFRRGALLLAAQHPSQPGRVHDKLIALVNSEPLVPAAGADDLRKLQVARYNAALEMIKWRYKKYQTDLRDVDDLHEQFTLLRDARLDLCTSPAERIAALEKFLEIAREYENNMAIAAKVDQWANADLERAHYGRLGLEISLLKARREASGRQRN